MLYVGTVPMMIPTAATEKWLQAFKAGICNRCPAGVGAGDPALGAALFGVVELQLNTNAVDPGAGLVYGDLEITDDSGGVAVWVNPTAAPAACLAAFEGPEEGLDGYWRLVYDQEIWTANGDGTTPPQITGVALVGDTGTTPVLLAYGSLPGGPANFEQFDILKLTTELVMRPQLPIVA